MKFPSQPFHNLLQSFANFHRIWFTYRFRVPVDNLQINLNAINDFYQYFGIFSFILKILALVMDTLIPSNRYIRMKKYEKLEKYQGLKGKAKISSVASGALETMAKLEKRLQQIPGRIQRFLSRAAKQLLHRALKASGKEAKVQDNVYKYERKITGNYR